MFKGPRQVNKNDGNLQSGRVGKPEKQLLMDPVSASVVLFCDWEGPLIDPETESLRLEIGAWALRLLKQAEAGMSQNTPPTQSRWT